MGYYTSHELFLFKKHFPNGNLIETQDLDIISELREYSEEANYALDQLGDTNESCKWYSHEKELKEFSKMHPEFVFKLHGEGEGAGDFWDEWYKDGKMQKCKVELVYPAYDESKLT